MTPQERFEQNRSLVGYVYQRHFLSYENEREDLISEGTLALWKACNNFDETRECKFSTYACVSIKNQMIQYIHNFISKYANLISLDDVVSDDGEGHTLCMHETLAAKPEDKEIKYTIEMCLKKMTNLQKRIIHKIMLGYTQYEIAFQEGISQPTVSRCLTRFKKLYEEEIK